LFVQHIKNKDSKLLASTAVLAPVSVGLFLFIVPKSLPDAVVKTIFVENGKKKGREIFPVM